VNEEKKKLIFYRLQQASEALADAYLLLNEGGSIRSIINRAYYVMFYSVLALLTDIGKGSSKHSGVIALFDQYFVKSSRFPIEMSKAIHKAFDLSQMGDYREFADLNSIMVNKDGFKQTEIGSIPEDWEVVR